MNNITFLSFEETPTEKHLGIATVRYNVCDIGDTSNIVKIILRFKAQRSDKGRIFVQPASNKITKYGKDEYLPAFQFDSQLLNDELKNIIIGRIEEYYSKKAQNSPQSAFSTQPGQMHNQAISTQPIQSVQAQGPSNSSYSDQDLPF